MWCPHCRQNAPIVYRGVFAYCSGCNQPRPPFSAKGLNYAGRPSKLGGTLGKVVGWSIVIAGLLLAAIVVFVAHLIAPASPLGWAIAIPLALIAFVVGAAVLYASARLHRAGSDVERETRQRALYAFAANRDGLLTSLDAARSLGLDERQVDALLGEWVKTDPDHVSLEVDDDGQLFYLFARPGQRPDTFGKRYRVEPEGRVRVVESLEGDEAAIDERSAEPPRQRR